MQRLEAADRFFAATGADIRRGGTRAYYAAGPDYVQMPPFKTALFASHDDHRPAGERDAGERYRESSLFTVLERSR